MDYTSKRMNMNTKMIAAVVVVVIVAASAGGALIYLNNSSDSKYVSTDNTGRLMIYGNADNNDYLDNNDVTTIEKIIQNGTWNKTTNPLADADQNGVINDADLEIVKALANRQPVEKVYYINSDNLVKSTHYPIKNIAALPNTTLSLLKSINAEPKIKGICGGTMDRFFFSDLYDTAEVMSSSAGTIDLEIAKGKIDAVVCDYSSAYMKNAAQFEEAGIDVIRINAASGMDYINYAITIGFLLDLEDSTNKFVEFNDTLYADIQKKVKTVDKKVTTLAVSMTNSVAGTTGAAFFVSENAGAKNIADWTATTQKTTDGDPEWLLNYPSDFIAHTCNYSHDTNTYEEVKKIWDNYSPYFDKTVAYSHGNYFLFNSNIPVVLRVAVQASLYYPDLFDEGFYNAQVQKWIDNFIGNLHELNFKAGVDGIYWINQDVLDELKG